MDYDFSWHRNKKRKASYYLTVSDENDRDDTDTNTNKNKKYKPELSESDSKSRVTRTGNHIYFYAGVSKNSVYELNNYIVKINNDFKDLQRKHSNIKMIPDPIYLHINSYGGSVFSAFAAVDFITQSKIPVYTIIEGATASAGTIMSIVGKKRYIRPNASMLIHQLSSWFGGKMTEIEDEYKNLKQMMETIKSLYTKYTKIDGDELNDFLKHDLWWKPDKCLKHGLVDDLWDPNK